MSMGHEVDRKWRVPHEMIGRPSFMRNLTILLGASWRREAAVLLHHRHASFDALVTDIYGWAGHKAPNLIGAFATERTPKS